MIMIIMMMVAVVVVKAQVHTIYRMQKVLMYTKCSATTGAFGMPISPLVMASLVPVWAGSWICQRPLSLRSTKAPRDVLKWDLDEPGELAVMIWKEQFLLTMFGGKACYYDAFFFILSLMGCWLSWTRHGWWCLNSPHCPYWHFFHFFHLDKPINVRNSIAQASLRTSPRTGAWCFMWSLYWINVLVHNTNIKSFCSSADPVSRR